MYVSKEMLGLGLLLPSTMIAIQGLKLYLGNKQCHSNASRIINLLEELMWVEAGLNDDIINNFEEPHWTESWIDEIKNIMRKRNIHLHSEKLNEFKITKNKTLMIYAREYVREETKDIEIIKLLNHVRLYKGIFLPCELVGQNGKEQTSAYRNNLEIGQIKWIFY